MFKMFRKRNTKKNEIFDGVASNEVIPAYKLSTKAEKRIDKLVDTLKIYCDACNILVSTVEDCESLKENKLCESCFVNKSFINKENIYN